MKKILLLALYLIPALAFSQSVGWSGSCGSGSGATIIADTSGSATANKLYIYKGLLYIGRANGDYALVASAAGTGDITSVTAGGFLTGGGTTGAVTLTVDTSKIATAYALRGFIGPRTKIKFDRKGNPNVMVWIPRFNWDKKNGFNSSVIHPAFVVNGVEKNGFWVAKYECTVVDSTNGALYSAGTLSGSTHTYIASSREGQSSRYNIDFDAARRACANMNNGTTITGWHLITNSEWAAIALWCKDNATMPLGNNNYGRDVDSKQITGTLISGDTFGSGNSRWLGGSGGPKTSHNWQESGIYDLNGNLYEWVDGMRLENGLIYVHGNANTSPTWAGNSWGASEANWYNTGIYTKWAGGAATGFTLGTGGRDSVMTAAKSQYFGTTTGGDSLLMAVALAPTTSSSSAYGSDYYYANNNGTFFPLRSGHWNVSAHAGVFIVYLVYGRSSAGTVIGFRSALIE